jgi:hypothetical protein
MGGHEGYIDGDGRGRRKRLDERERELALAGARIVSLRVGQRIMANKHRL